MVSSLMNMPVQPNKAIVGYHTAGRINLLRIDIGLNIYFVMALNNHEMCIRDRFQPMSQIHKIALQFNLLTHCSMFQHIRNNVRQIFLCNPVSYTHLI